jgi:hypothetical protein
MKKLTSVEVQEDLYQEFKVECIRYKFSFQKLADRALFLYITDKAFRELIHSQTDLKLK